MSTQPSVHDSIREVFVALGLRKCETFAEISREVWSLAQKATPAEVCILVCDPDELFEGVPRAKFRFQNAEVWKEIALALLEAMYLKCRDFSQVLKAFTQASLLNELNYCEADLDKIFLNSFLRRAFADVPLSEQKDLVRATFSAYQKDSDESYGLWTAARLTVGMLKSIGLVEGSLVWRQTQLWYAATDSGVHEPTREDFIAGLNHILELMEKD